MSNTKAGDPILHYDFHLFHVANVDEMMRAGRAQLRKVLKSFKHEQRKTNGTTRNKYKRTQKNIENDTERNRTNRKRLGICMQKDTYLNFNK